MSDSPSPVVSTSVSTLSAASTRYAGPVLSRRGLFGAAAAAATLVAASAAGLPGSARAALPALPAGTRFGATRALGHGQACTFATVRGGRTRSIGIFFTEHSIHGHEGHTSPEHADITLEMPAGVGDCAIEHITIGYMPNGHEPEVFSVPHFDLHFYLISEAEKMTIDPARADYVEKANKPVPAGVMPAGFVPPVPDGVPFLAATVPMMGLHWLDAAESAVVTGTFDHEFINGSWDGKWNFLEPMLTQEWLLEKERYTKALSRPAQYPTDEAYPTKLDIRFDAAAGGWVVELTDMVGGDGSVFGSLTGSLGSLGS